ncbi:MAG: hypothetical protein JWQ97_38 [Phenylobacterium sp.]|nr:hypothetical protein [Phenylobacterium sp.]
MEKGFHVQRVATKIKATERSLDETLALAAELLVEMKTAQDGLGLGPIVTDTAFAKLTDAMGELAQARSSLVATHKRLAKIHEVAGLRTVAGGTYFTTGALDEEEAEDFGAVRVAG